MMGRVVQNNYTEADQARWAEELPKRVAAPDRTPFERDRARVVHAAATRRLAAKTQVVGPQSDDFVRNRLTHSLEVAQISRDLARALGCEPDIAETAALAHDLGHPPFGHNGERMLAELSADCGGFEGNAQTFRLLTRLEAKTTEPTTHRSAGLNLTRATLDACTKYPWTRSYALPPSGTHADGSARLVVKFGVYDDDFPVFDWVRGAAVGVRQCVEAQIMDLADDVAYSVHDVEDAVVAGRLDLTRLDHEGLFETIREWYTPHQASSSLADALAELELVATWPKHPYDGSRLALAQLKNLTSDLIGRFCESVRAATFEASPGPFVRHRADLVVPEHTLLEIAVLKGIAAHYVMQAEDRIKIMHRQRELLAELVALLWSRGGEALERPFADDWQLAVDDTARRRVLIDQVASLTDASALAWHQQLTRVNGS
jgi:dGTPase